MFALAHVLIERNPKQPAALLVLGEVYMQSCKNDWKANDRAAIERNLSLSIDATRRALALDPERQDTRALLVERERRLRNLQTPKSP